MKKTGFLLFCFLTFVCVLTSHAQATTAEAQGLVDAVGQTEKHWWSLYMLGMAQLIAALVTLSLLFNLRSLAFLFLIVYGSVILCVPYYVPSAFQITFGGAIIVMSVIGLLSRLLLFKKKPVAKVDVPPATPVS